MSPVRTGALRMKQRQQGFLLLELVLVLGIVVSVLGLVAQQIGKYMEDRDADFVGQHANLVVNAAERYTNDNYASLLAIATDVTPAVFTVSTLKTAGYLPSTFSDANIFGQSYEFRSLEPVATPGQLRMLMVTIGGTALKELPLRRAAATMGPEGGYITATNTTIATGHYGTWSEPLVTYGTTPGAGHIAYAMFIRDAAKAKEVLFRQAVGGRPEYNRMETAIDLNGNNINNGGLIASNKFRVDQAVSVGGACSSGGEFARTAAWQPVMCDGANWIAVGGSMAPPGSIFYTTKAVCPAGSVSAIGQILTNVSTNYPNLISGASAVFYNSGANTYLVPDMRGEFVRGWDNGRGADSGRGFGTWQDHAIQWHDHRIDVDRNLSYRSGGGWGPQDAPDLDDMYHNGANRDRTSYQITGNGAVETRPRNIALLTCMSTG